MGAAPPIEVSLVPYRCRAPAWGAPCARHAVQQEASPTSGRGQTKHSAIRFAMVGTPIGYLLLLKSA